MSQPRWERPIRRGHWELKMDERKLEEAAKEIEKYCLEQLGFNRPKCINILRQLVKDEIDDANLDWRYESDR